MASADDSFLTHYIEQMRALLRSDAELLQQLRRTRDLWLESRSRGGKVIFIGNGGSAGIAAHLAIDAAKNAGVPATCFNDGSLITCLANDYGFENWMAHALRLNAAKSDCLVAISSSGRSNNVINAAQKAREMGMSVVTLSGMATDNPLRALGDVNFWADSRSYNMVETTHQFWMMCVIDLIIGKAEYPAS
jgi:phosphoheptose isomerase